jgi:ankyrin repeat protein
MKNKFWKNRIDITNRKRKTALMIACEKGNENIVKLFLKEGANPNKIDI